MCSSAFKNKGVQPMLDAVLAYLPAPTDIEDVQGTAVDDAEEKLSRKASDDEALSALAFKVMTDPFVGSLTRIYSGLMEAGSYAYNSVKGKKERIGRLLEMHANERQDIRLRAPVTSSPSVVSRIPPPVTPCAIKTSKSSSNAWNSRIPSSRLPSVKTKADVEKMSTGLIKPLKRIRPSTSPATKRPTKPSSKVWVSFTSTSSSTVSSASSRLKIIGAPQVNYRGPSADIKYTHKKQSGGSGQYAEVQIKFEPLEPGTGFEFATELKGTVWEYIPGVSSVWSK